jgi:hypothetical protein
MNETLKEINKAGFCVIEFENYYGNSISAYLVNLKEKKILDKTLYTDKPENDIVKEVMTSDIEELIKSYEPEYSVADIDGDYIFNTGYLLVRLQKNHLELTDEMIERNDEIDNAVFECIKILAEYDNMEWDMAIIGEVTDAIKDVLNSFGIKVRHPAVATEPDGTQYYVD